MKDQEKKQQIIPQQRHELTSQNKKYTFKDELWKETN